MKVLLVGLFVSFSALAAGPVLIDAACKTSCVIGSTQITTSSGYVTQFKYADVYVDYKGLTREELDKKSQKSSFDAVCKKNFAESTQSADGDCLTFKHN